MEFEWWCGGLDACLAVLGVPVRICTSCLKVVMSAWTKVSGLEMDWSPLVGDGFCLS